MKTLLVLSIFFVAVLAIRDQSIAVKGRLLCGSAPARNVRVKLWDEDDGPDPDDQLDAGYTNANGEFTLKGGTAELTGIDPVLKIYHDCDDGIKPGSRKVKFQLPSSYVTEGKEPKKTLDIGTINLEIRFQDEERELIVSRRDLRARYEADDEDDESGAVVTEKETRERRSRQHKHDQHDRNDRHDHDRHDHSKHQHGHKNRRANPPNRRYYRDQLNRALSYETGLY